MKKEGTGREILGSVVIGTVEGDIHEVGKTIVATMLSVNGFEVFDLGINVTTEAFITKVKEVKADILAMSALLSTTMGIQDKTIKALVEAGLRDKVKVMIGGAPTSRGWCDRIGADGYGENANEAVAVAKNLILTIEK
jgi:methylmalonyl-CoA mutase cobalamin-binding domain/chain